jgi:hypothetical protein
MLAQMPSGAPRTLRFVRRLRSLSEDECYARCYRGWEPTVTIVKLEPRRPRYETSVSGEALRRFFEERIDARVDDELDDAA